MLTILLIVIFVAVLVIILLVVCDGKNIQIAEKIKAIGRNLQQKSEDELLRIEEDINARNQERIRQEQERKAQEEAERERRRLLKEKADHLREDFFRENPYVALSDWQELKKQILEICPFYSISDTEIVHRNQAFKTQQLAENKTYFDTLLTYPLDDQQREAVVTLGENVLVVAAAGSGKTSTIVAKAHFLVEKMHVDPRNILVVTYTRKAAEELQKRVGLAGVECSTFHKHALDTISRINGDKPSICESTLIEILFESMIHHNATFESSFLLFQTIQKTLLQYDYEYSSYKAYLKALMEYGKMAPYRDMDGNLCYVKSRQEMEIMVILTELGLKVRYEEKYPYPTSSTKFRQYKPDFTIHYEKDGQEKVIYLEHYAVDKLGRVPVWFGDGKQGGWSKVDREYHEGMHWKQQVHADNGTTLIYTTSADFAEGMASVREHIIQLLSQSGVPMQPLSMEQKTQKLAVPLNRAIESITKLAGGFIALIKANGRSIPELIQSIPDYDTNKKRNTFLLQRLIQPLYERYQETLKARNESDFTDCLLLAARLLNEKQIYNYDYILVDEFQDMSMDKYTYLNALRRKNPRTRIFCVGDDWQSIYRFSGSDLSLFSQFEKFNGPTDELKIEATHRFGNPLLERSSEFILRNPKQKKKTLRPDKDRTTYLAFAGYETEQHEREIIEQQVGKLPHGASVYLLARYRFDIGRIFPEVANLVRGEKGGMIEITIAGRRVKALTAHSCKGLEADYIFLLNCNSGYDDYGFPSQVSDDPILEYVLSRSDAYPHAEERRLFYVAITRARRASYVLFDKQYPSLFVTELGGTQAADIDKKKVCPRCGMGSLMFTKDGYARNGHFFTVLRCTNKACDLQNEMIFFNPEQQPFEIVDFEAFLSSRHVTAEERHHIRVGTSPDFVAPILNIPCVAESPRGLALTIDPRYDRYDLEKFYLQHLRQGDLAVCIQHYNNLERLLLTIRK